MVDLAPLLHVPEALGGILLPAHAVPGEHVDEHAQPVAVACVRLVPSRAPAAELREQPGLAIAGHNREGGLVCERVHKKLLVVLAGHEHVDVVVPGDESLMPHGPQKRPVRDGPAQASLITVIAELAEDPELLGLNLLQAQPSAYSHVLPGFLDVCRLHRLSPFLYRSA